MHPMSVVNVEIDGLIVQRSRTPRVLATGPDGRATVWCTQPELLAGEMLVPRRGQIPMIVREEPCPT